VLTEDSPWEPYSAKFAASESAARAARSVTAIRVTRPRSRTTNCCVSEAEEYLPRKTPRLHERCIAVASRLEQSHDTIELVKETLLGARLVAAVNIESTAICGDGLDEQPVDATCPFSEDVRCIAGLSSKDRGPTLTKEILSRR
jgi:hypothetical protein